MNNLRNIIFITLILFLSHAIYAVSLTDGLVSYYSFSGNANDGYGTNNGGVNGAYLTVDKDGNPSSAYGFDGLNDYIDCGSATDTQFKDNDSFSISAWVNVVSDGTRRPVFDRYRYGMEVGTGGLMFFWIRTLDGGAWTSTQAISDIALEEGKWYHITGVYDDLGSTQYVKLYINGQLVSNMASDPLSNTYTYSNQYIGRSSHVGGIYFNGSIDEVRVYNRAIGTEEIEAMGGMIPEPVSIMYTFVFIMIYICYFRFGNCK